MTIYPIETGNFKLDGGAMFGVVPKSIWNRTNPADQNNMIDLAARCLLIEDGDRLILIDNGLGNKQSEKFFSYYYLWGDHTLDGSLEKVGFHRDDVGLDGRVGDDRQLRAVQPDPGQRHRGGDVHVLRIGCRSLTS